nr:putative UDP-rhamnose:rhamnosyltransferase 1 [Quercus suber]
MADQTQKLHTAMLRRPAFGHIIPFLDLAKNIAQKGHRVSYLATHRNIQRLPKVKLPPYLADSITFVQLPLHNDNSLPENAEATMDIPHHNMLDLKRAYHGLQEDVAQFLENSTPDWIIYDIFAYWLPPIAGCEVNIVRSCVELEPEWLKLLKELHQKPVVPVCILPPTMQVRRHDHKYDTWDTIIEWLDKQEKGSVVYVALGSEVRPSQEDLNELAPGLEQSGLPFFWTPRKRSILGDSDSIELPADGFEGRIKGRGVAYTSWVPLLKILAHDSVGGFLTHNGWGLVIEGLYFARPLIMLPYYLDQGLNARILEEKVGVEVPRNKQDGSFTRNAIANSLKLEMLDDEGKIYWKEARKMSLLFGDKDLNYQHMDKLIEFLEKIARNTHQRKKIMLNGVRPSYSLIQEATKFFKPSMRKGLLLQLIVPGGNATSQNQRCVEIEALLIEFFVVLGGMSIRSSSRKNTYDTIKTGSKKTSTMQEWPELTASKALRDFLDLIGYYMKQLKQNVANPPVWTLPYFSKPFNIECDALGVGLGVLLMQNQQPIAFHSQVLKGRSPHLSTYEKELLGLVTAIKKWGPYLVGKLFIINIDQQSLKFLLEQKFGTHALQNWLTKLLGYVFVVEYKN